MSHNRDSVDGETDSAPVGSVISVSRSPEHYFSKEICSSITLIEGMGVKGDAHMGRTVKHRSRMAHDPDQPNLRQVHLLQSELLSELRKSGFMVGPGDMGENITTSGVDLLSLPKDTVLRIGNEAVVVITGLRNPCYQLDDFQEGLMNAVLDRDEKGRVVRKSGVMGVVLKGGDVASGDTIHIVLPDPPRKDLEVV